MPDHVDVQRRRWLVQLPLVLGALVLGLLGEALGGRWFTPGYLAVLAIVLLVRGGPGERLLVVSVCLAFVAVVGFALMLIVLTT